VVLRFFSMIQSGSQLALKPTTNKKKYSGACPIDGKGCMKKGSSVMDAKSFHDRRIMLQLTSSLSQMSRREPFNGYTNSAMMACGKRGRD